MRVVGDTFLFSKASAQSDVDAFIDSFKTMTSATSLARVLCGLPRIQTTRTWATDVVQWSCSSHTTRARYKGASMYACSHDINPTEIVLSIHSSSLSLSEDGAVTAEGESVGVHSVDELKPRTHLPPLLNALTERKPERLDYLGASWSLGNILN